MDPSSKTLTLPRSLSSPIVRYKQAVAKGKDQIYSVKREETNAIQIFINTNDNAKITIRNSPNKLAKGKIEIKTKTKDSKKSKSNEDPIKKMLRIADEKFDNGKYESAAKKYISALKQAERELENKTVLDTYKYLYLSQMEIWKNEKDPLVKLEKLEEATATLKSYLKKNISNKVKSDQIVNFWIQVSSSAFSHIETQPVLGFQEYAMLQKIYQKFGDKSDPSFPDYLDELHHNLTVCISNQENIQSNSTKDMVKEAKELITKSSASQEKKSSYHDWLNRGWDERSEETESFESIVSNTDVLMSNTDSLKRLTEDDYDLTDTKRKKIS